MARYRAYGSYGERLGAFREAGTAVEVAQPIRQRPLLVSASVVMTGTSSPTPEQIGGYARLIVYAGTITASLADTVNIQSSRIDWSVLGVNRIFLNHVFRVNKGFTFTFPSEKSALFSSQENEVLGALLVCPCDQNGLLMDGDGTLTFYGSGDENSDTPRYKVI